MTRGNRRPARRRPVLIGWAQVSRFEGEPLGAWAESLRATGVPAAAIESLDVVYCQSWPYDDPPGRLAEAVGADPRRRAYSGIGGTTPLELLAGAARRIEAGEAEVCAVVGGEALATLRRLKKEGRRPDWSPEGRRPDWSHRDPVKRPFPFEAPFHPAEVAHQVFQAYTTFALRDTARRARQAMSVADYSAATGELFSAMTQVAATNPHAWFPTARTAEELTTPSAANRMVAHPYTKLLTAIMDVDLSAAFVVASEEAADRLGVPAERRVHVRGWGVGRDPDYVAEHDQMWRSPAMRTTLETALGGAGAGVDDVAHFDLYSCFPSSVWFSLDALGLAATDARAPFTVTGGLPYAGGPGSAYTVGSVAAMADRLVADPGALGLVSGVGMHLSKHAAVVLSTDPGRGGRSAGAGFPPAEEPIARRPIAESAEGPATIVAYTVHHGPDATATDAVAVCDVGRAGGARCYARSTDPDLLPAMEAEEWVGRTVRLVPDGAVNMIR